MMMCYTESLFGSPVTDIIFVLLNPFFHPFTHTKARVIVGKAVTEKCYMEFPSWGASHVCVVESILLPAFMSN